MTRAVLVAILLLFSASSPAQKASGWETFVFPSGEGAISISDQECSVPKAIEKWEGIRTMARVRFGEDLDIPKQSRLLWHGTVYAGCYVVYGGSVLNIDSKGERLLPPPARLEFKPHEGALPAGKPETGV